MEHFTRDLIKMIANNTTQLENMDFAIYNENEVLICFVRRNMRTPSYLQIYNVFGALQTLNVHKSINGVSYSKPLTCKSKNKLSTLISQIVDDTYWGDGILETYTSLHFQYREGYKEFPPIIKSNDYDLQFSRSIWEELSSTGMNDEITEEIIKNTWSYLEV